MYVSSKYQSTNQTMAAASSSSLAAPSLPPSSLTANTEKANYIRLSRLLVDIGTAVLQEVFDSFHPSPTLHGVLTSPTVNTKLKKLRARNILNTVQWDILYPPATSGVVTSKRFDITLLFLLLRNICNLKKTSTGWDKDPSPTDHSMSADVLRIKMSRNKIYAHAINLALNKNEFDRCWAETEEALIRLDVTNHVKPKIQSLRVLPLDIENDECYKVLLRGLEDKEDKTFDALAKISKDVEQLKEEKHSKCMCHYYMYI
ncbi:E3 ubiquitin-protein ligase DZIP3 [Exaiptasia diaphana]|nr:E3 ubiquitin-protein ligase DZIP3 [Exaiptasia diaphana]